MTNAEHIVSLVDVTKPFASKSVQTAMFIYPALDTGTCVEEELTRRA